MTLIREFLLIGMVVCIGSAYSLLSGLAPQPWVPPELAPGEIRLADTSALEVIWLDARSAEAYAESHLPGAFWFDLDNWDEGLIHTAEQWLENPRVIVVYCSSESCSTSREVAEQLRLELPDAEIYSLKGGWNE